MRLRPNPAFIDPPFTAGGGATLTLKTCNFRTVVRRVPKARRDNLLSHVRKHENVNGRGRHF